MSLKKHLLSLFFFMGVLLFFLKPSLVVGDSLDEALRSGNVNKAIEILKQQLEKNPQNIKERFYLGNLYYRTSNFRLASEEYLKILSQNPHDLTALNNLAFTYKQTGDLKKCIYYWKEIVKLKPNSLPIRNNLIALYISMGNLDGAIEEYEAIEKFNLNINTSLELAKLYIQKENYPMAAKTLSRQLKQTPTDVEALQLISEVYLKEAQLNKAWETIQKALTLEPDNTSILLTHAKTALARNNPEQAVADCKKILAINPSNPDANKILVETQEKLAAGTQHTIIFLSLFIIAGLIGVIVYFWKTGGRKDLSQDPVVQDFMLDFESLTDLNEIGQYVLTYFTKFLQLPKGIFFLKNREGTELKSISSNYKVLLLNLIHIQPDFHEKWSRSQGGKIMTTTQIYKTPFFYETFSNAKEVFEKNEIRLVLPFYEKKKLLALLALGGISRFEFRDLLPSIRKKIKISNLLTEKASAAIERSSLYELSFIDEQTKIYNKRFFMQIISDELKRVQRYQQPCSLLMIDIDHFKQLNDEFGHPLGDSILREMAEILKKSIRDGIDTVSRYGGEEFTILLPATPPDRAKETAERIRNTVSMHPFIGLPLGRKVTISVGVATYPDHSDSQEGFIKAADDALYESKNNGRNCVTLAGESGKEVKVNIQPHISKVSTAKVIPSFDIFKIRLEKELQRAKKDQYEVTLVSLRVKNFEALGSPKELLSQLTELSEPLLRMTDFYSSPTPDSLIFLRSGVEKQETIATFENLSRKAKEKLLPLNVQLEISLATFPQDGTTIEELIAHTKLRV